MPSKKRKYNARFPAGRIKKIMQTDEEVGKVAQAVPIIISRTLELFVESLLSKAMQVTVSRNAKTLSPSHVKQCILAESRFDFLRDLVKNIPDVSAAEEKEMMSAEDSPNSSRFSDVTAPPRRIVREDSNSSSSSDVKLTQIIQPPRETSRSISSDLDIPKVHRTETVTSAVLSSDLSSDTVIDLSKKASEDVKPIRTANFYQETLLTDEVQHKSVIKLNPTYSSPQPSTSTYTTLTSIEPLQRVEIPVPKPDHKVYLDLRQQNNNTSAISSPRTSVTQMPRMPTIPMPRTPTTPTPRTPTTPTPRTPTIPMPRTPTTPIPRTPTTPTLRTPITPILNIDFTKSLAKPEIKVLDAAAGNIPYSVAGPKNETTLNQQKEITRQNSKTQKAEFKAVELKPNVYQPALFNMDHLNSGNLQIDEDYDT